MRRGRVGGRVVRRPPVPDVVGPVERVARVEVEVPGVIDDLQQDRRADDHSGGRETPPQHTGDRGHPASDDTDRYLGRPVQPMLASAGGPQDVVLVAAALAAAGALLLDAPRQRAFSMLAALALAAAGVALLHPHLGGHRAALLGAAAVAGVVVVLVLAAIVVRRPEAFAVLTFLALPFRIPVSVGGESANLLVPLYVVIAAGALAYTWRAVRAGGTVAVRPPEDPRLRRLQVALALVLVLYAVQALYSTDLEQAVKNTCFFYVPFALLLPLLVPLPWSRRLLMVCLGVVAG